MQRKIVHMPSWADYITTTPELKVSEATGRLVKQDQQKQDYNARCNGSLLPKKGIRSGGRRIGRRAASGNVVWTARYIGLGAKSRNVLWIRSDVSGRSGSGGVRRGR